MKTSDYIEERLEGQMRWYSSKSQWNQRCYKIVRMVEISAAALIPFLSALLPMDSLWARISVGSLGILIVILSGLLDVCKFEEHWYQYRNTIEALKHEKYAYLARAAPYNGRNADRLLVQRVESLISVEHVKWLGGFQQQETPDQR